MIHPNVKVSGLDELKQARAEDFKLHHPLGQMPDERALLFLQPGNMRVTKKRDAVRAEADDLIHRVCKTLGRLVRQAIDQIHVDALESHTPGAEKQIARHFERLDAVNSFLHFGLKILNAHAQPVEAQLAEGLEVRSRSDAGIDLYSDFTVRRELKTLARNSKRSSICSGER